MIVDVRFMYEASVKRQKKRLAETLVYEQTVPLVLREVDPDDAPVAVRYETRIDVRDDAAALEDLRWFEGTLWAPNRVSVYSGEPSVHRDVEWYVAHSGDPNSPYGASPDTRYWGSKCRGVLGEDREVREVVNDRDRTAKVADAQAELDRVIAVRGMTWKRVREPRLVVSSYRQGAGLRYVARVDTEQREERASNVFRLDHGRRIGQGKGIRPGLGITLPEVQVLVEGVLKYRADERYLIETGSYLLGRMKASIAEGSRDYFRSYADLRDAHALFEPLVDDVDCDFGPYARTLDACASVHVARPSAFEETTRDVDQAVERWRSLDEANEVTVLFGM